MTTPENPRRWTFRTETTEVRYVAKPLGRARENGPHLVDLRTFVAACEGLPDDLYVRIDVGHSGESGRHDITFSITQRVNPDAIVEDGGT